MNMGDEITVHQVEIPIEELSAALREQLVIGKMGECRYCHEEEWIYRLEAPCRCDGSLKYAHRRCISHWCNVKRSIRCEICREVFSPNFAVTEPPPLDEDDIPVSDRWTIPNTNIGMVSPLRLIERGNNHLIRSMVLNTAGGVIFGTLLLMFLASMIIRDAYYLTPPKEDMCSRIMYLAVVFITVPLYVFYWILACRGQQELDRIDREREMEREREM